MRAQLLRLKRQCMLSSEVLFASTDSLSRAIPTPISFSRESVGTEKYNPIIYFAHGYRTDSVPTEFGKEVPRGSLWGQLPLVLPGCERLNRSDHLFFLPAPLGQTFSSSSCSPCVTWKHLVITAQQQLSTYSITKYNTSSFPPLPSICTRVIWVVPYFVLFFSWIDQYKCGLGKWASASVVFPIWWFVCWESV